MRVILADGQVANLQVIKNIQRAIDDLATLKMSPRNHRDRDDSGYYFKYIFE